MPFFFFSFFVVREKVYEALHLITSRDIKGAAALLLECVSTFTCTELCSYNDFILYTVVTNILTLPRTTLKKKIVDGPEVCVCVCLRGGGCRWIARQGLDEAWPLPLLSTMQL